MNEYLFGALCIIAMALLLWDLNKPFKARHVSGGYRKGSAYIARCRLFYITGVDRKATNSERIGIWSWGP